MKDNLIVAAIVCWIIAAIVTVVIAIDSKQTKIKHRIIMIGRDTIEVSDKATIIIAHERSIWGNKDSIWVTGRTVFIPDRSDIDIRPFRIDSTSYFTWDSTYGIYK